MDVSLSLSIEKYKFIYYNIMFPPWVFQKYNNGVRYFIVPVFQVDVFDPMNILPQNIGSGSFL